MDSKRMRAVLALAVGLWLAVAGVATQTTFGLKDRMSAAQFERAGLHKLTAGELSALDSWLAAHYHPAATSPARSYAAPAAAPAAEMVMFNTLSGKYHCASCQWAVRCTRNCLSMPLSQARARGVPCKVCRGSCG